MVTNIMFGRRDLQFYVESRCFMILRGTERGRHEHKSAQNKGRTEHQMLVWNVFISPSDHWVTQSALYNVTLLKGINHFRGKFTNVVIK